LLEQVVAALQANGGRLNFDDNSSPELIRQRFGVSKKSFKQALGALYKTRRIAFLNPGMQLLDNSTWEPGASRNR
jgi:predicted RNA-binding protein (virulence factor B family)